MRNWEEYEELVNKANNSTGVTFENQEKYAASLEGRIKELSATTTSIGENIFKSDDLSVIVSGLTKIAGLFDTITSKTKLLGSIGLGAGIFAGVKNIGKTVWVYGFQIIVIFVLNMPFMPKSFINKTWISKVGMCELGQLTMFYKMNRNWGLLSLSAGKLYYSE